MKKIIFKISFVFLIFSCDLNPDNNVENDKDIYHDDELISMVYMSSNNKTKSEIDKFSEYYQNRMNDLEPDVLSWKFFNSDEGKIILLERYKDEAAIFNHINNVSEGNPMEKDFIKFLNHFQVDSIQYFGKTSQNFKDTIESFGFPISYKTLISGYSK